MRREIQDLDCKGRELGYILEQQKAEIHKLRNDIALQREMSFRRQANILSELDLKAGKINLRMATLSRKCLPSGPPMSDEEFRQYIREYIQTIVREVDSHFQELENMLWMWNSRLKGPINDWMTVYKIWFYINLF